MDRGTCQNADKVLDGDFIASIIDLNVVAVEIEVTAWLGVDTGRKLVARIARDIICQHKDDVGIWDAKALYGAVPAKENGQRRRGEDVKAANIPRAFAMCCESVRARLCVAGHDVHGN